MKEQDYQTKIMKAIEAKGGWAVNGNYTKAGEPDLQCGWPVTLFKKESTCTNLWQGKDITILAYLAVEVKTEKDYYRVMKCLNEVGGEYVILNGATGLKKHEPLQVAKINMIRKRGGLALFAYDISQIEEYVNATTAN